MMLGAYNTYLDLWFGLFLSFGSLLGFVALIEGYEFD